MINSLSDSNGTMRDTFGKGHPSVKNGAYRPNLNYEVERVSNEGEKQLSLVRLLRENEGMGVIYAATVREVKAGADYLRGVGFDVAPYHGQLGASERRRNRDRFLSGDLKAIVATGASELAVDALASPELMEIDKPDIRFVIHYDLPISLEAYYRESGRAGRDGGLARCTLLFQIADRRTQLFYMSGRSPKPEEVIAVYETLKLLGADLASAPLEQIQTSAGEVARIKVRTILSLLKNMGFIKEHRGARYTLLKPDLSEEEMIRLASEYTSKGASERQRLERMTLYAQSPECRWKLMLDFVGAEASKQEDPQEGQMGLKECGHCDNCSRPAAERSRASEGVAKPDFINLLFAYHQQAESPIRPGDVVKLPAHGEVKVKAVEGDKIVVSLPGGETRKFKQEWVINDK
jgi:ATP-dependent DNA helicase RecQ